MQIHKLRARSKAESHVALFKLITFCLKRNMSVSPSTLDIVKGDPAVVTCICVDLSVSRRLKSNVPVA